MSDTKKLFLQAAQIEQTIDAVLSSCDAQIKRLKLRLAQVNNKAAFAIYGLKVGDEVLLDKPYTGDKHYAYNRDAHTILSFSICADTNEIKAQVRKEEPNTFLSAYPIIELAVSELTKQ